MEPYISRLDTDEGLKYCVCDEMDAKVLTDYFNSPEEAAFAIAKSREQYDMLINREIRDRKYSVSTVSSNKMPGLLEEISRLNNGENILDSSNKSLLVDIETLAGFHFSDSEINSICEKVVTRHMNNAEFEKFLEEIGVENDEEHFFNRVVNHSYGDLFNIENTGAKSTHPLTRIIVAQYFEEILKQIKTNDKYKVLCGFLGLEQSI